MRAVSTIERVDRGCRASVRRRGRRGITVFVVLIVLTMLTAVGVFAARASTLNVTNAGRYRESAQAHYVAEAGVQGIVAEVSKNPNHWVTALRDAGAPTRPCRDIPQVATPAATNCLVLGYDFLNAAHKAEAASAPNIFVTGGATPGTFGRADVRGNFAVELTDLRPGPIPPGYALKGDMEFKSISMRGVGQLTPNSDVNAAESAQSTYMQSTETLRAEVVVGPIPK
jgi:hypothetical protein